MATATATVDTVTVYQTVRDRMRVGDVIFYGGKGPVSDIIKAVTGSPVSHVGTILRTRPGDAGYIVEVIESTSLDGFTGVTASRFSSRLLGYEGEVWWASLSDDVRRRMDEAAFVDFLHAQDGKPYDARQAILAGLHRLGIANTREDLSHLFCSELVAGALVASGAIPRIDPSGVTPAGLAEWRIYNDVIQLKGEYKSIPRCNSLSVAARGIGGL